MLRIDGSRGEGGGQILRASLALSLLTQTPFRIENIRAGRKRPGLMRQHITGVQAAAAICDGEVSGAALGSTALEFAPGKVRPGSYEFSVGSAGSTSLVLQAVLPALAVAHAPSVISLHGGTHALAAPPFEYLSRVLFPLLGRMGPWLDATLLKPGYYPAGGGHVVTRIEPTNGLQPLVLLQRGAVVRTQVIATVSRLSKDIAAREVAVALPMLGLEESAGKIVRLRNTDSPGNVLMIDIECEHVTELFTGVGQRGKSAEAIAAATTTEALAYLAAGVPVGPHLADQLVLWMAFAGDSAIRTMAPTQHTRSQIEVLRAFGYTNVHLAEDGDSWVLSTGAPARRGTDKHSQA